MKAEDSSESLSTFHQQTTRRHIPTEINPVIIFTAVRRCETLRPHKVNILSEIITALMYGCRMPMPTGDIHFWKIKQ
jgi:hypothetical protein